VLVENGLSLLRDRGEVSRRLRYTFLAPSLHCLPRLDSGARRIA
jgi:hypothetical protein